MRADWDAIIADLQHIQSEFIIDIKHSDIEDLWAKFCDTILCAVNHIPLNNTGIFLD